MAASSKSSCVVKRMGDTYTNLSDEIDSLQKGNTTSRNVHARRKLSLMPLSNHGCMDNILSSPTGSTPKRSSSLPNVNHPENVECDVGLVNSESKLSRTRSVSFHPEIVGVNAAADNDVMTLADLLDRELVCADYKTDSGMNLLHFASMSGSLECLRLLIDHGAQVNCQDDEGNSALDYAVRGGFFDCASFLIKAGAREERIVNGLDNFKK